MVSFVPSVCLSIRKSCQRRDCSELGNIRNWVELCNNMCFQTNRLLLSPNVLAKLEQWVDLKIGVNRDFAINEDPDQATLKEIISQTDYYLVNLSSKTYVFEDKMTKY